MGITKINRPATKWDAETLANCLENTLEYTIEVGRDCVILLKEGELLALVDIVEEGEECIVSFNQDLYPGAAAEIALALERFLPTAVEVETAFTAEKISHNEGPH